MQSTSIAATIQFNKTRTPNVAFRAILSKNLGKVTAGKVIVFDQVDLNHGNAYGARHGFFTAPYNGTYLFSMGLGNPAGKPGAFFLRKNGKGIEYAFAGHTTGWNMGGITTVAELSVDDQVWIEGEGYISGAYATARYHTSFSGVLLNAN
ncbi:collagen alpha-1(X) chain-like [Mercenaria mercenaria]|uniref:collagen alpha-1(X) chain-like n=1 Tax=Mercenaria mercenaria TaxID=6596 RepID=UPI00234F9A86|nr:collagen alpha-1(X) chain-like [Mercenaria mercenaria]